MKLIDENIWKGGQSLEGERIVVAANGTKIRARITRDAYERQSSAIVQAWTDTGWTLITSKPPRDMTVFQFTYGTRDDNWMHAMLYDLIKLAELGQRILA